MERRLESWTTTRPGRRRSRRSDGVSNRRWPTSLWDLEHVGSMAVPELAAKPISDVDVVVEGSKPHRHHVSLRRAERHVLLALDLCGVEVDAESRIGRQRQRSLHRAINRLVEMLVPLLDAAEVLDHRDCLR
jgi:hypothetical protein